MRKVISGFEDTSFGFEDLFFSGAAALALLAAVTALLLRHHLQFHNERVQYGVAHLPGALISIFLFTLLAGLARAFLVRSGRLATYATATYLVALVVIFCVFWLPVLLAGGFVQDDWLLLAAASIRRIIYLHPAYSWYALDTVDGNFRPLGTVLYIGYMLRLFGLSAHAFLAGNLLLSLLGSLVAFFIVRELGYSKVAGAAASLLYMSRGVIYTIVGWVSAISDDIAILLCGLMALAILKANKHHGLPAILYHLLAWACFCVATLGKQSAFAAPLIVALLLLLRPGEDHLASLLRRIVSAALGLLVYAATAAVPFYHAKTLLQTTSPYPISFSPAAAVRSFSYAIWFFINFDFPARSTLGQPLIRVAGFVVVIGLFLLAWKIPRLLGDRPRDVLFAALASLASISLFIVLNTRAAPYYGTMAAFWMSIALAIALTRFGPEMPGDRRARVASFAFCLLVVSGFADIRLRQTALIPSGGYIWGTFGMDRERLSFAEIRDQLAAAPDKHSLVLVDFPFYTSYYTAMSLIADPRLQRILLYDSQAKAFSANDQQGLRPSNSFGALRDPLAYNWVAPVDAAQAGRITSPGDTLWLRFRDGNITAMDSIP